MNTLQPDDYSGSSVDQLLAVIAFKQTALKTAHEGNQKLTFEVQKKYEEIIKLRKEYEELKLRFTAAMKDTAAHILQLNASQQLNTAMLALISLTATNLDPGALLQHWLDSLATVRAVVQSSFDFNAVVEDATKAAKKPKRKPKSTKIRAAAKRAK